MESIIFGRPRVCGGRRTRGREHGVRVLTQRGRFGGGSTVQRSSFDRNNQSDGSGPPTLNSCTETGRFSAMKRTRLADFENHPPSKQRLIVSSTASSYQPLGENKIFIGNLGYVKDEGEYAVNSRPILAPMAARILFEESEDEDQVQAVDANLCLQWPPQPCFSPRCHFAASHSTSKPKPMPEPGPKPEPDITPTSEPDSTPKPEPDITPKPEPDITPKSEPDFTPEPEPDFTPMPEPDIPPKPEPDFTPMPEPDFTPMPEPDITPKPEPDFTSMPDPDIPPKPEQDFTPMPEPDITPKPEQDFTPMPEPDITPKPEQTFTPMPEQDFTPMPEPDIPPKPGQDFTPKTEPTLATRIASSTSSSHEPLEENETLNVNLGYGSEEDSGEEEGDDVVDNAPILVPRAARIFFDESEDEDQVQAVDATLCLQWPPQPCLSSRSHSAAPNSTCTPEPMPESGLSPEPDITYRTESTLVTESVVPFNKFNFMWRPFPQSQIQPNLRRETFSDCNCGPTATYVNPYEAFTAIWDRDIMEHIAAETNRYARQLQTVMQKDGTLRPQSRIRRWRDTDADELYVFFALIIATGIVVKPRLEEYWNKTLDIFSTPGFTSVMPYQRFQLLARCLHFQNNDGCNPKSMTRPEAKLYKIKTILEHLNNKFATLYNMSQNVALDESLTMWKGWLDNNQFIHNKAASVGIKTYEVCESQTGYLWRFVVHTGRNNASSPQEDDPLSAVVPSLVLRLLNGLEHKGHTIWMNNYYNSPVLARELKVRGFDCVGTLRTNRKFVPPEIQDLKTDKMAFGQVFGCTSGDVDLVVWRDKKRVALISTYHGLATVKCGGTLKPSIISEYNVCMGGLDRKDQMLATYPIERQRTKVWYKKFFRRLLNVSVLNAYILLKSQHTITHRSFRKTLVNELILKHSPPTPSATQPASLRCFPAQYNFLAGKLHERQRRKCTVCRKRTNTYCKGCNVPLCIFTCFEPHHYQQ